MQTRTLFSVGELIRHRTLHYRGVVVDVGSSSQDPHGPLFYSILVDQTDNITVAPESELQKDPSPLPIRHPSLEAHFHPFKNGKYVPKSFN